jgi:hypothetical protein
LSPPSGSEPEGEGFEEQLVQARTARETPTASKPAADAEREPVEAPADSPREGVVVEPAPEVEAQTAGESDRRTDTAPVPEPDSDAPDEPVADIAAAAIPVVPDVALLATREVPGVTGTTEAKPSEAPRAIPQATLSLPSTATKTAATGAAGAEPVVLAPLALEASAGGAGGEGLGGNDPQSSGTSAPKSEAAAAIGAAAAREPEFAEELSRSVSARETQRAPGAADSERAADILRQVRVAIGPGLRRATIALTPPSLGRIHIRMSVRAGALTAVIRAEEPAALQALAHQLPELRATLAQQGIAVEHVDLGLGFETRQDAHREHPTHDGTQPADRDRRPAAPAAPRELHRALARASARGGIDTYA